FKTVPDTLASPYPADGRTSSLVQADVSWAACRLADSLGAWVTSTRAAEPVPVTRSGPPDRLQRLPRALARPGQIQGPYARFAATRLSPSARERLRRPGRGGRELAGHPASAGPPRNGAARRQDWGGRRRRQASTLSESRGPERARASVKDMRARAAS